MKETAPQRPEIQTLTVTLKAAPGSSFLWGGWRAHPDLGRIVEAPDGRAWWVHPSPDGAKEFSSAKAALAARDEEYPYPQY